MTQERYKTLKMMSEESKQLCKEPIFHEYAVERGAELARREMELSKAIRSAKRELPAPEDAQHWIYEVMLDLLQDELDGVVRQKKRLRAKLIRYGFIKVPKAKQREEFDIPALKEVPIEDLHAFEKPRITSNRISCLCPFHLERTPSFVIYRDSNTFHCFGCQANGDSIAFVMKYNDLDFKEACKYLKQYV